MDDKKVPRQIPAISLSNHRVDSLILGGGGGAGVCVGSPTTYTLSIVRLWALKGLERAGDLKHSTGHVASETLGSICRNHSPVKSQLLGDLTAYLES